MKFLTVAALVAGLAAASGANAATNLLTNGSFELGANGLQGWTLTSVGSGQGYSPTIVITTDGVGRSYADGGAFGEGVTADNAVGPFANDGGSRAIYFSSDVGTEALTQNINLASGWYNVGFDAYVPANGYANTNDALFTATVGDYTWDPVLLKGTAIGAQNWKHYSQRVYIEGGPDAPTSFTFAPRGYAAVDVLVDRVYITAVPEPGTWALMILGFGSAGAMLRSQRRRTAATA